MKAGGMTHGRTMAVAVLTAVVGVAGSTPRAWAGEFFKDKTPAWLDVDLQVRHRYEWVSDFDFNDNLDDEKGRHLYRTRLSLTFKPVEALRVFYQFQDSRISHDSLPGSKAAFENWADTRQLWVEAGWPFTPEDDSWRLRLRIGRQEFAYGEERLLGGFNWSNVAQTFDGGKLILDFKDWTVDFFGGGKTAQKSPREADDFYSGDANDTISGVYAVYRGWAQGVIESYLIRRDSEGKTVSFGQTGDGPVEDYTIGVRTVYKPADGPWDGQLDAAYQFGQSGSLDVSAAMLVAVVGYTFDHPWSPRVAFEFNYASGDNDSSDDERNTFDNLHPTNHKFYGYMDFVSLQNINNYHVRLSAKPHDSVKVQGDYHLIYLDTPKDNLYAASRGIKRATAPGADAYVGSEVDLTAHWTLNRFAKVLLGYSHFFAGDFLEDTGSADDADFVYVQTLLRF